MSVGISMIETPVRFSTESITREVALDVGRLVFAALNKAELVALVILLVIVRVSGNAARWWAFCAVLALIVIAQSVWLTPELADRAQIIIDGGTPPESYAHAIYSSLELIKIGTLLWLGFQSLGERSVGSSGS